MSDLKHTPFQSDPLYDNEIETSVDDLRIRVDVDPDGRLDTDEVRALRDHIVRAVNCHDDFVAAVKDAIDLFAPHAFDGTGESCGTACIRALRAALAKAEGNP